MERYKYLLFVDSDCNSNKFYEATENSDGSIDIKYGRIGNDNPATHHYRSGEKNYNSLINSKLKKGYRDCTSFKTEKKKAEDFIPLKESDMQEVIAYLTCKFDEFMATNYTVSKEAITWKMITEARNDLDELIHIAKQDTFNEQVRINVFNQKLKELFLDIPRAMRNVYDFVAKNVSDFDAIIERESEMLKNLEGMFTKLQADRESPASSMTLTERYGIDMTDITYDEEDDVLRELSRKNWEGKSYESAYERAYHIGNSNLKNGFNDFCEKNNIKENQIKFFFHGTRISNVWSILKSGLKIGQSVNGRMFGAGIYFSEHGAKSINYTSMQDTTWGSGREKTGWLLGCKVAMGKPYIVKSDADRVNKFSRRSKEEALLELNRQGCDSVYAVGKVHDEASPTLTDEIRKRDGVFRNSEIIIYNEQQCFVDMIIEVSSRDKDYFIPFKQRMEVRFDDGIIGKLKNENGKISVECNTRRLDAKTMEVLKQSMVEVPKDIILTISESNMFSPFVISEKGGKGNDLLSLSLSENDRKWFARQVKRVFADTDREFAKVAELAMQNSKAVRKEYC